MIRKRCISSLLGAVTLLASLAGAAPALAYVNWPSYQLDAGHSSLNRAATRITPANAGALAPAWSHAFAPAASGFSASPVVYNGSIYIGGNNGGFYQLNETTGALVHRVSLGREVSCPLSIYGYGVEDTATVAPDPGRGGARTVYVTGGNGKPDANGVDGHGGIYLWALDAGTLKPVWRTDPITVSTQPGATGWASPVVSNGNISIGIASSCDSPEVRGGLRVFSQSDGAPVGTYWAVPAGNEGGPIWSTPAASGSSTWLATGNATSGSVDGDSYSIVRLHGATKVDSWTIPGQTAVVDNDFGASPTLFTGLVGTTPTTMIGDCNKNGIFYALRSQSLRTGPVWTYQLAASGTDNLCNAGAVWDAGAHELIMGSTRTPTNHPGSIQALSPDANAPTRVIWQAYLPCPVEGAPSEDGAGVLAVVTFSESADPCSPGGRPSLYLYNAHTTVSNGPGPPVPQLLKTIPLGSTAFSQPAFADSYLFVAGESNGKLMAYAARSTSTAQIKADLTRQLAPSGKAAKIGALLRKGGFTFRFRTVTGGRLKIAWYASAQAQRGKAKRKPVLLAIGQATSSKAGLVKVTIKLTRTGRRMLKAARSARLIADGMYLPTSKTAVTAAKTFTLRR